MRKISSRGEHGEAAVKLSNKCRSGFPAHPAQFRREIHAIKKINTMDQGYSYLMGGGRSYFFLLNIHRHLYFKDEETVFQKFKKQGERNGGGRLKRN